MALLDYVGLESAPACGGMLLNYAAPIGVEVKPQVETLPTLGIGIPGVSYDVSLEDSEVLADSISATVDFSSSATEALAAADAITATADFSSALTEALSAADSQVGGGSSSFPVSQTESVTLVDAQTGDVASANVGGGGGSSGDIRARNARGIRVYKELQIAHEQRLDTEDEEIILIAGLL